MGFLNPDECYFTMMGSSSTLQRSFNVASTFRIILVFLIEFKKISQALLLFAVSAAKPSTHFCEALVIGLSSECASLIEPLPGDAAVKTKNTFFFFFCLLFFY